MFLAERKYLFSADDIPPQVNCPISILQSVPSKVTGRFVRWWDPVYTDESTITGQQITVTQTHTFDNFFPIGTTRVIYNFKDWAGNEASCSFKVIIQEGKGCVFDKYYSINDIIYLKHSSNFHFFPLFNS